MPSLRSLWSKLTPRRRGEGYGNHEDVVLPTMPDWIGPQAPLMPRPSNLSAVDLAPAPRKLDQSQSIFFQKLPREIRLIVYEYALGYRLIHLGLFDRNASGCPIIYALRRQISTRQHTIPVFTARTHLRRFFCKHDDAIEKWGHSCADLNYEYRPKDPEERLLALLQTCRAVYAEAISVLYQSNVFHIKDMPLIQNLSLFILSERIQMIRKLKLHLSIALTETSKLYEPGQAVEDHIQQKYLDTWRVLSELKGLQELRVCLAMHVDMWYNETLWIKNEPWITEPIRAFPPLPVFEIYLPSEVAMARLERGQLDFGGCTVIKDQESQRIGRVIDLNEGRGWIACSMPIPGALGYNTK